MTVLEDNPTQEMIHWWLASCDHCDWVDLATAHTQAVTKGRAHMADHGHGDRQVRVQEIQQATGAHCPTCTCAHSSRNPVAPKPIDYGFAKFWAEYPRRGNRPQGHRAKTLEKWCKLTFDERKQALKAAHNHAIVAEGYTKDAERFLANGFWRDWVDVVPEVVQQRPSYLPPHASSDGNGGWLV